MTSIYVSSRHDYWILTQIAIIVGILFLFSALFTPSFARYYGEDPEDYKNCGARGDEITYSCLSAKNLPHLAQKLKDVDCEKVGFGPVSRDNPNVIFHTGDWGPDCPQSAGSYYYCPELENRPKPPVTTSCSTEELSPTSFTGVTTIPEDWRTVQFSLDGVLKHTEERPGICFPVCPDPTRFEFTSLSAGSTHTFQASVTYSVFNKVVECQSVAVALPSPTASPSPKPTSIPKPSSAPIPTSPSSLKVTPKPTVDTSCKEFELDCGDEEGSLQLCQLKCVKR